MLSRSASTAAGLPGNKAFGQVILDIFDMNAARKPATGSTTGRQVALSREVAAMTALARNAKPSSADQASGPASLPTPDQPAVRITSVPPPVSALTRID